MSRSATAATAAGHQLPLRRRHRDRHLVRRDGHDRRPGGGGRASSRSTAQAGRRHRRGRSSNGGGTEVAGGADPQERRTDAPGVQLASLRERDDALHPQPRAEGRRPRHLDDPARLVHDEAQRRRARCIPVSWEEFSRMHPFAPADQTEGYRQICDELEHALCEITGFAAVSLQPNSGAQGEFAGLAGDARVSPVARRGRARRRADSRIRARHQSGERRSWPASRSSSWRPTPNGNVDVADLKKKAAEHANDLAGLMITYPSTHGVFEDCDPRHLRDRPRARRPGLHGRRQHERAGRPHQPGDDRRRRLPPEPAQDVRDSARRRRSRHGPDRRREAPRAVPARTSAGRTRSAASDRRFRRCRRRRGAARSILLISYGYIRMLGGRGRHRRDALRDPQRQLHQVAAREALRRALHARERPRRARDDLRPARVQGEGRRGEATSRSG